VKASEAGVLAGRTAVVTGTSANIGGGIAVQLARAGARVACVDFHDVLAKSVAADIEREGGTSVGIQADITNEASVGEALSAAASELGLIDILVNGAVVYNTKGVTTMPLGEWRKQLSVMLDGALLCTQWVSKGLIAAGRPGSVINLISTAGHQGEPNNIGYTTAKGGLLNFTRSAAVELAANGIRVNSVTPTATDMSEAAERLERWGMPGPDAETLAVLERAAAQVPLKRLPKPSDYGNAVVFLASDAASMITGIDLRVDAGSVANYWRR